MDESVKTILKGLTDDYGTAILEDPDRLSQFLENRSPASGDENFRLTFALRYLLKSGWTPDAGISDINASAYAKSLCAQLGYKVEDAEDVVDVLRDVTRRRPPTDAGEDGADFVARPGNLRRIAGGIANRPRTMWLRKKSFYNGVVLIAALLAIMVLFFQIGSQRNPVGDEFRIAFFNPMSGSAAASGHAQLRAAQLAVEQINRQGGVRGYKLKIVGYDLPLSPSAAAKSVREAMKDKSILVMMTGAGNDVVEALAPVADEISVPLVATSVKIYDEIAREDGKPYLYSFRIANNAYFRAKMLAYFAVQGLSKKKIGISCGVDDPFFIELREFLPRWITVFGGSASDVPILQSADADGLEALILLEKENALGGAVKSAREAGYSGPIISCGYTDDVAASAGGALAGSWWINEVSEYDPQIRSLLKEYQNLYNEKCPSKEVEAAVLAYDGVRWIANALYQAPGYRGEAVRHALLSTRNFPMTHATLTIDPRTHGPLNKAMALVYCADNKGIFQKRILTKKE